MTRTLKQIKEQIQEDIISYASVIDDEKLFFTDNVIDELCQIVVDNINKLIDWLPMARTLKHLKESIERLIEQQGEMAPVAALIFTQEDVFTLTDKGEQVTQPLEIAERVLDSIDGEYVYLYEEVFNCIDYELNQLGVID